MENENSKKSIQNHWNRPDSADGYFPGGPFGWQSNKSEFYCLKHFYSQKGNHHEEPEKWIPSIGMVLTAGTLLLTLTGCAPTFEGDSVKNADAYVLEIQAMTVAAADLVGPWHLAEGTYDETAVNETFPGAMEFGSSMEITGDGKISWYIGADGGAGTYALDGNILLASMTNDFDGTDMTIEFTVEKDGDQLLLTMDYKDLTLCWSWGEKETGKGGDDYT